MKRPALLIYRIGMVFAAVVLCVFAATNEAAFGINAYYFPRLSNPVAPWHTKLFLVLALVCVVEGVFALFWRAISRIRNHEQ